MLSFGRLLISSLFIVCKKQPFQPFKAQADPLSADGIFIKGGFVRVGQPVDAAGEYVHFKGNLMFCQGGGVKQGVVDIYPFLMDNSTRNINGVL